MKSIIRQLGIDATDIVSVIAIPFIYCGLTWFMTLRGSIVDNNQFTVMLVVLFSLITILYRNKLTKFIWILVISVIISNLVTTIYFYSLSDFLLIFWFGNALIIGKSALIGFVFIKVYYFFVGNRVSSFINKLILVLIFITVFIGMSVFVANSVKEYAEFGVEIEKRDQFIQRITQAIGNDQLKQFSNQELIDLGITSNIYKNDGERILGAYGGDFHIQKIGQDVSMVFEGIPAGETCFKFYSMNNPQMYGFNLTRVDGITNGSEEMKDSTTQEFFEKKVCHSGEGKVTIEFIGAVQEIVDGSRYLVK